MAFRACNQLVEIELYDVGLCGGQENIEWHSSAFEFCKSLNRMKIPSAVIGVRKWRMNIEQMMKGLSSTKSISKFHTIHSKLVTYARECRRLKEAAFLLELALWKSKVDESLATQSSSTTGKRRHDQMEGRTAEVKMQCRINCGADMIIPNVLPYLIANK